MEQHKATYNSDYYEWKRRINILVETAEKLGFEFEASAEMDGYKIIIEKDFIIEGED